MIPSLSQEVFSQYASNAQTIQQPQGADYSQGVKAGRTIPAKWWNWLFSASTKRIIQSRTDANNILTELKNVVTDAGFTPTASDSTQLKQAIVSKADVQISRFVESKKHFMEEWYTMDIYLNGVQLAHKGDGNQYPEVRNPHKVNNLYFGEVYGYDTSGTVWYGTLATSTDLIHWTSIVPELGYNDITKRLDDWGVLYFNGHWMCVCEGQLFASSDGYNWTALTNTSPEAAVIFVINDTFYYAYSYAGTASTQVQLWSSQDGEELTFVGAIAASLYAGDYVRTFRNATPEVIHLTDNKYLLEDKMIIDISARSATLFSFETVGHLDYYLTAFRGSYYIGYQKNYSVKIDSAGNVETISVGIAGAYSTSEVLFSFDSADTNTDKPLKAFSFDGTTYTDFPNFGSLFTPAIDKARVSSAKKIGANWFIAVYGNGYVKIFKTASLSSNINDYTEVSSAQKTTSAGSDWTDNTHSMDICVPLEGMITCNNMLSKDNGETWAQGYVVNSPFPYYSIFCASKIVGAIYSKYYGAGLHGHSRYTKPDDYLIFYTTNAVNNVLGHTLYLY